MAGPSLLTLPTELRLQIYEHLLLPIRHSERFSYMYRYPGRVTQPGPVSPGPHLAMLSVCQRIRDELLDVLFRHRQFIMEASLYEKGCGGILPMPYSAFPSIWFHAVTRLVLFTILDHTTARLIADLRPLQLMTGLQQVWLVCSVLERMPVAFSNPSDFRPIEALLECIPQDCVLRIGYSQTEADLFISELGWGLNYILDGNDDALHEQLGQLVPLWTARKGRLSGNTTDHSVCASSTVCKGGNDCFNSAFRYRAVDTTTPISRRRRFFGSR